MHQVSLARILILAFIVFGIAACGKSSNEDLHEARQLLAVGETEQALEVYKKILADDPQQVEAHRRVAEIYIDQEKIEEAREHVTEAVALAPEDPDTFYVHGRFLLAQKLWLQAGEALEIAARENLFNPDVQFYFATALAKLGEEEKAIGALLKVQGMKPDYPGVNAGIGDLYFYTGAYDKAMQSYEQAIVETPDDARIVENLALAYHYQNFNDSAEKTAKRALDLNPESAGAYNILGAVAFAHREIDEAEKHFKKAILLDPKLTAPHVNLGAIFNAKGRIDESLAEYQKALELEPGNIPVQKNLGDLYFTKGEISLALKHYRTYHQQRPKDPFVAYVSAKLIALTPDGDPQEGHDMLNKFERATGLDVAMNEVRFAMTTGRAEPTGEHLDELGRTYNYLPDLLAVRAVLYERMKDMERAKETIEVALLMTLTRDVREMFEKRVAIYKSGKVPPSPFKDIRPPPS